MAPKNSEDTFFSRRPSEEQMKTKYQVLRCPPGGLKNAIILSHDVVGAETHFANGRTRPCMGEGCETCDGKTIARWRGYVAVVPPSLGSIYMLELTPAAMVAVDKAFKQHNGLRGCTISLSRKNGKANGELFATIAPPPRVPRELPAGPSQKKFLQALWQLKELGVEVSKANAPKVYKGPAKPDFGDEEVA